MLGRLGARPLRPPTAPDELSTGSCRSSACCRPDVAEPFASVRPDAGRHRQSSLRRREAHLLVTGVVLAVAFDAPFIFVSKAEQYHLIALGAILALTGAFEVLSRSCPRERRAALASALALRCCHSCPHAQHRGRLRAVLGYHARRMRSSIVGRAEIQQWLRDKAAACRGGTLVPLPARSPVRPKYGRADEQGRRFVDVGTPC